MQKNEKLLLSIWKSKQVVVGDARLELATNGLRVAEAHHDGTPHWHLVLFMSPKHEAKVTLIMRDYLVREDANEHWAQKHRFTAKKIDPSKGSATGYISKYISKGLDAEGLYEGLYGDDAKQSCKRIRAWASRWGIRQFQQIGGPPVTLYREFRRMKCVNLDAKLTALWEAADNRKMAEFLKLLGGPDLDRKSYTVTIAKEWSDKPNRYDEPRGYQIVGVNWGKVVIKSGRASWTIKYVRKECARPIMRALEGYDKSEQDENLGWGLNGFRGA